MQNRTICSSTILTGLAVFYSNIVTKEPRELSFILQQFQITVSCGDKVLQDGEMKRCYVFKQKNKYLLLRGARTRK